MGEQGSRDVPEFDACQDAEHRWPGWKIRRADLAGRCPEVIVPEQQLILVEETRPHNRAVAHCVAHLDLGHHKSETFTDEHEEQADWLADLRIDGERSWGKEDWWTDEHS